MSFNFKNVRNDLLSPGDIFWKKNSGDLVMLSKKGDLLNHALIKKLVDTNHEIVMINSVNLHQSHEMNAIYQKYSDELLMRSKILWRDKLIALLKTEFVDNKKSRFELNHLGWKLFSAFSPQEQKDFVSKDLELFKRHLSIATAYTFSAFLLGYYETRFLSKLFTDTLRSLMDLGKTSNAMSLKEKIDYLRLQESFSADDFECVKEIAGDEVISKTVIFEKYDGSGMRQINGREMNDLEMVLVAINRSYGFENDTSENVLRAIYTGNFNCDQRLMNMIKKVLDTKPAEVLASA